MNSVSVMQKKSVEERRFEASLQHMASDSFSAQTTRIENDRHAYLTDVAKIVVKILDFRASHPKYRVPKSFTWEVCKYKKEHGYCWSEDTYKKAHPCGFPHSYALQRAALYVIRKLCKFGDGCTLKERCKFRHPDSDDIIIAQIVNKILQDRISAPPRPRKNRSVQSITSKAIAHVAKPSFSNLVPLENRYSELSDEEICESTSSPQDTNVSSEDEEAILFVPRSLPVEEVPKIATPVYASIFGGKNEEAAFCMLDYSPIGPSGIVDENDEILPFVPRSLIAATPLPVSVTEPSSLFNENDHLPQLTPFFEGVDDGTTFEELEPATSDSLLPMHDAPSIPNGLNSYPPLVFIEMFITTAQ